MESVNNKKKWIILAILFAAWFVGYCDKVAINVAVIPMSKEFGLNPTQIGLIISAFSTGMAITALLGGFFADKFGSKKVLLFAIIVWSLFSGFTSIASSFTMLVALRFIYGGAEGFFPPASSVTIAENFKKEEFGRTKSFLLASGQLGTAFGTLIVSYLAAAGGWRMAFIAFGGLGLLIALALAIVDRGEKRGTNVQAKPKAAKVPLKEVFKNSITWKVPLIQFGGGFFMWGLNSWLPQYWVKVKHLDLKQMGAYSMFPTLAGFAVMLIAGWLLDKYFAGREKHLLIGALAFSAFFVFMMYNANSIVLGFLYNALANLGIAMMAPVNYALILKYVDRKVIGSSTGLITFMSGMAGIVAPTAMGYSITLLNGSYAAVFGMIIVICIICMLIAATINTNQQNKSQAVEN